MAFRGSQSQNRWIMRDSDERALEWKEMDGFRGVGCSHCGWVYRKRRIGRGISLLEAFRAHLCDRNEVTPTTPSPRDMYRVLVISLDGLELKQQFWRCHLDE
jgi:hypothetical protein